MADDRPVADTAPSRRRVSRLLIVSLSVVVVLGALGGAGWWWFDVADAAEDGPPEEGEVVTVEPMTVGLAERDEHARLGYGLVLAEGETSEALDERMPMMKDATLERVAEVGGEELGTPEGMNDLKERLAQDAREIFNDPEEDPVVLRVVLTELVVR